VDCPELSHSHDLLIEETFMSKPDKRRVLRGGGWRSGLAAYSPDAFRHNFSPGYRDHSLGVRLVESHTIESQETIMIKMHDQVTNDAWKEFDLTHTYPTGHGRKPVTNVTYTSAMEYARWLSARTGRKFRLPTEEERMAAEATNVADFSNHPLKECPDVGTFGRNKDGVTGLLGVTYDWCLHPDDLAEAENAWQGSKPTPPTTGSPQPKSSLSDLLAARDILRADLDEVERRLAAASAALEAVGIEL